MKLPISAVLFSSIALMLSAAPSPAALVWADFTGSHAYESTVWDFNVDPDRPPLLVNGEVSDLDEITISYQGSFWFDSGYRNSGTFIWSRPGISAEEPDIGPDFASNPHSLPAPSASSMILAASGGQAAFTGSIDFSSLSGGVLPAGSWLYFSPSDETMISFDLADGWSDLTYHPGGAGLFWRTAADLPSISWTFANPSGWSNPDTGEVSKSELAFGIIANVPEPSMLLLLTASGLAWFSRRGKKSLDGVAGREG